MKPIPGLRSNAPWYLVPAGLMMFGIAAWAFHVVYEESRLARADVATTCKVIKVKRDDNDEGNSSRAQVTIAHVVDGQRYERLDEGADETTSEADVDLQPFRANTDVPCRYVRGHPDLVVVLWRRKSTALYVGIGIGNLLFFGAMVLYDRWLKKRKKKMRSAVDRWTG